TDGGHRQPVRDRAPVRSGDGPYLRGLRHRDRTPRAEVPQPRPRAAATRGRFGPGRVGAAGRRPGTRGTIRGPRRLARAEQGGHQGRGQRRPGDDPGGAQARGEGGARRLLLQRTFLRLLLPRDPLPEGADASKATADFHKGVLEITVPAPARRESKAKRLEIREGK